MEPNPAPRTVEVVMVGVAVDDAFFVRMTSTSLDATAVPTWGELRFEDVVRGYEGPVFRMAHRMTADTEAAREIGQEVFETVWAERKAYVEQGQLKCYVFQIARHKTLAWLKKRKRRAWLWSTYGARNEPSVEQESGRDLSRALAKLSVEQRELIVLRHVVGLSTEELASLVGVVEGTIKSRLSRALETVREELSHG